MEKKEKHEIEKTGQKMGHVDHMKMHIHHLNEAKKHASAMMKGMKKMKPNKKQMEK